MIGPTRPFCIILTGPPGAGKTTLHKEFHNHLPLVDIDKIKGENKEVRKKLRNAKIQDYLQQKQSFVFTTAAPTRNNKDFWSTVIGKTHDVILVALVPPRMVACQRMLGRGHHDRLQRGIEYWYRRYQPHPTEWRVDATDVRGAYGHGIEARLNRSPGARGRQNSEDSKESALYTEGRSQLIPAGFRAGGGTPPAGDLG